MNNRGFGAIQILLAILVVSAVGGIGWYVYSNSANTPDTTSSTPDFSTQETKYYEISDLKIKIKLTDGTEDLISKVSDDKGRAFLSLRSFVKEANDANASVVNNGVNDCERLALIRIYQPSEKSQLENDPVQSYRFDSSGKPLDKGVVLLSDGRYVRISMSQSTCMITEDLQLLDKEIMVRNKISNLLENNIESLRKIKS